MFFSSFECRKMKSREIHKYEWCVAVDHTLIRLYDLCGCKCYVSIDFVYFARHKAGPKLRFDDLARHKAFTFFCLRKNIEIKTIS